MATSLEIHPSLPHFKKPSKGSLAGVAQWIECQPVNQRVTGLIPSQGTCLGWARSPVQGMQEATTG